MRSYESNKRRHGRGRGHGCRCARYYLVGLRAGYRRGRGRRHRGGGARPINILNRSNIRRALCASHLLTGILIVAGAQRQCVFNGGHLTHTEAPSVARTLVRTALPLEYRPRRRMGSRRKGSGVRVSERWRDHPPISPHRSSCFPPPAPTPAPHSFSVSAQRPLYHSTWQASPSNPRKHWHTPFAVSHFPRAEHSAMACASLALTATIRPGRCQEGRWGGLQRR